MTPVVMICRGLAGGTMTVSHGDPSGAYLAAYDPEAYQGRGVVTWTRDPEKAKVFDSIVEAIHLYRAIPKRRPMRQDGRPNRPLMAYSVEFVQVEALQKGSE